MLERRKHHYVMEAGHSSLTLYRVNSSGVYTYLWQARLKHVTGWQQGRSLNIKTSTSIISALYIG